MQKSVLIVEDEFLIAMDLQAMLEDHGWRVLGPAANVRDAFECWRTNCPLSRCSMLIWVMN